MLKTWFNRLLRLGVVLGLIAAIAAWVRWKPTAVKSHRVQPISLVAEVMGTGTLEARVQVSISPKIAARISEVRVDQGDSVEAGQELVRLEDDELKQRVEIAEANQQSAEAAIRRLESDRDRATAVLEQAQKNYQRIEVLVRQNAASQEELDKATEALAIASAGVSRADAAINEGQKELITAQKTLGYEQTRLSDATVTAPFDGLIVRRLRNAGDVVVPGSSILTLIATEEIWISAWVDETEMARLEIGQPARVLFRSEPERSYPGTLARLGREADRETREFIVDVRLLELPEHWAVGQRAEVYLEVDRRADALAVPPAYVVSRAGQTGVYVRIADRAVWRPLELGLEGRQGIEVTRGLVDDEELIMPIDLGGALFAGRRVK